MSYIRNYFFLLLCLFLFVACKTAERPKSKPLVEFTPELKLNTTDIIRFADLRNNPVSEGIQFSIPLEFPLVAEPTVVNGTLYMIDSMGMITAYSLKDKKPLWRNRIRISRGDIGHAGGGILHHGKKLYVTYGSKYIVMLNAETGLEEFRKQFPGIICVKPVLGGDNMLLVQTVNNTIHAVDLKDFAEYWNFNAGATYVGTSNYAEPIVTNGMVVAGFGSGKICALNLDTGKITWSYPIEDTTDRTSLEFVPMGFLTKFICHDGYLYVATGSGFLLRLHTVNGIQVWKLPMQDIHSMCLNGTNLVVTNNGRQVAVIDSGNGKISWVGNLLTQKEKKSKSLTNFMEPFISKYGQGYSLNVITPEGRLYSFPTTDGQNPLVDPQVLPVDKGVQYQYFSDDRSQLYLVTARKVICYDINGTKVKR